MKCRRIFKLKERSKVVFLLLFAQVEHLDTAKRIRSHISVRQSRYGVENNRSHEIIEDREYAIEST